MPDIAILTFLLTISSRRRARAAGKIAADATTGPDGFYSLQYLFVYGVAGAQ